MIAGKKKFICAFAFVLAITLPSAAAIELPKIIGSNMVLQCNKPIAIWGNAIAGESIIVTFDNQVKSTVANSSGKWLVYLDPSQPSVIAKKMVVSGSNTITLENILVGEVWLCSGQSNMEFTMAKSSKYANASRSKGIDSAALTKESNKNIRLFLVKRDLTKSDGGGVNKGWNEAEGAALSAFSAAGYHFAKTISDSLQVPVGMIAASVSGSNIDPWLDGEFGTGENQQYAIDTSKPGKFFTGLVQPLAPFTLNGFLWYQGETNCFLHEISEYSFKFKHLIQSWRTTWNDNNAPFYFVQIAPFEYSKGKGKVLLYEQSLPEFRQAQAAALGLPKTGMIITTDLVDNTTDIHPTYKWEIGRRLALLALANDYKRMLVSMGPVYRSMQVVGKTIELAFDQIAGGLISSNGKLLNWFEIAGADGVFRPAKAVITGEKVKVYAKGLKAPKSVRFGWHETAQPNLFNSAGLPAAPFTATIKNVLTTK
ncbi:MAG: sialate O-acetylesterase [Bacteroidota bacterium]